MPAANVDSWLVVCLSSFFKEKVDPEGTHSSILEKFFFSIYWPLYILQQLTFSFIHHAFSIVSYWLQRLPMTSTLVRFVKPRYFVMLNVMSGFQLVVYCSTASLSMDQKQNLFECKIQIILDRHTENLHCS